ncbi:hypothetical protein D3C86_2177150 [compost metagenome]
MGVEAKLRQANIGETHASTQLEHFLVLQAEVVEQLGAAIPCAVVLGEEQAVEVIAPHLVVGNSRVVGARKVFGRQVDIARIV